MYKIVNKLADHLKLAYLSNKQQLKVSVFKKRYLEKSLFSLLRRKICLKKFLRLMRAVRH